MVIISRKCSKNGAKKSLISILHHPSWWRLESIEHICICVPFRIVWILTKRSVFKVPKFLTPSSIIFTSVKRLWSCLTEPQRPVCIVFHLYWTVTYSGTTQIKLRIIFRVKKIPCLSPKINFRTLSSNILNTLQIIFGLLGQIRTNITPIIRWSTCIKRFLFGWPLKTGSKVVPSEKWSSSNIPYWWLI